MPLKIRLMVEARDVEEWKKKLQDPNFVTGFLRQMKIDKALKNNGPWPACESDCSDDEVSPECKLSKEDIAVHHCSECRRKISTFQGSRCETCAKFYCSLCLKEEACEKCILESLSELFTNTD